jgi:phosphoesterase RecJ-like protein
MSIVNIFKSRIQAAHHVVITTHVYPDADGIGSQVSLCMALRKLGKNAICVNDEALLDRYRYLDPDSVVIGKDQYVQKQPIDLFIVVDTNTVDRVGEKVKKLSPSEDKVLYIDHHPILRPMDNHCIDTRAAATGEIIGYIIEGLGIEFDQKLALPLYTAIIIDTSSFRYPNVSARTHSLISKLLSAGIKPAESYNYIYGTKKIQHMHLLGAILSTTQSNSSEEISWIVLSKKLVEEYRSDIEDTHAFINHLLVLDKIKVACMFRDDGESIKVSMRSTGEYDVGLIAKKIGGGGHSHSAATVIERKNNEKTDDIIKKVIADLENEIQIRYSNSPLKKY